MKRVHVVFSGASEQRGSRRSRRNDRWPLLLAAALGSLIWAAPAAAKPEYPEKMMTAFNMPCTPGCLLCHTDPNGGPNWNQWILAHFTMPSSADPAKALAEMLAAPGAVKDFDGDTLNDDIELLGATDPSAYGALSICIAEYGCGAHLAKSPPPKDLPGTLALLVGGVTAFGLFRRKVAQRRTARAGR